MVPLIIMVSRKIGSIVYCQKSDFYPGQQKYVCNSYSRQKLNPPRFHSQISHLSDFRTSVSSSFTIAHLDDSKLNYKGDHKLSKKISLVSFGN